MSVVVRHFLSDQNGDPRRQLSSVCHHASHGLPSSRVAKLCPEPDCSKPLVSGKKENPVELSKSPSSVYNLLPPLIMPCCWAYGDETATMTALPSVWMNSPCSLFPFF